jgi:hypothetical protein|tara:strand:+ start:43 stop:243 length:201 start_codon:yes stop_codon:yes gene_type:complete
MQVGDLGKFPSDYSKNFSNRMFCVVSIDQYHDTVKIAMFDNGVVWLFDTHELQYCATEIKPDKKCP